ncbi:MAG: hypothetical protein KGZ80_03400 [Methylomonas sp.]|nr:hypothetical protein [Methylomonas sp.]
MNTLISIQSRWLLPALLAGGITSSANAALLNRGNGMLYDTVLNVTWLQDANYAKTSGYDADGWMSQHEAMDWAANLVFHDSVRNVDYSDWRLPRVLPVNGVSFNYRTSPNGSTDWGHNITSPNSELSFMYYVNLGLKGWFAPNGERQYDWGIFGDGTDDGHDANDGYYDQNDVGPVKNLQASWYWTQTTFAPDPDDDVWTLMFAEGSQMAIHRLSYNVHAWAVRDGDVAAVPLPAAAWLFGSGLLALAGRRRAG